MTKRAEFTFIVPKVVRIVRDVDDDTGKGWTEARDSAMREAQGDTDQEIRFVGMFAVPVTGS
jgi:hypothetical protein